VQRHLALTLALSVAPGLEYPMAVLHPIAGRSGSGRVISILFATAIFASSAVLVGSQATESAEGWIQRSDAFAARLIQLEQRLRPETAVSNPELDDQVSDLSTDSRVREAVLPKCPPARRMSQALYQFRLRQAYGVELSPAARAISDVQSRSAEEPVAAPQIVPAPCCRGNEGKTRSSIDTRTCDLLVRRVMQVSGLVRSSCL
jgi:hypothetical protein